MESLLECWDRLEPPVPAVFSARAWRGLIFFVKRNVWCVVGVVVLPRSHELLAVGIDLKCIWNLLFFHCIRLLFIKYSLTLWNVVVLETSMQFSFNEFVSSDPPGIYPCE